jgi:redox-sensitive bicupin YhaK (pirin superfamily)
MINIIKSTDRHYSDFGWLQTYWHFSFGDYVDPKNESFGALRVFNDDVVQPGRGFDLHPHRDMEIITYVTEGALEHKDNQGNRGVVRAGEVQVMSAGKGILHAEYNASKTDPVRLMQIWITPRAKGNKPQWSQRSFSREERLSRWLPAVTNQAPGAHLGGTNGGVGLTIDQDANVLISSLPATHRAVHRTDKSRKVYLFVISGQVTANGQILEKGDQARIEGETQLDVVATSDAELILLDLA